jgi:hypothetical protein
MILDISLKKQKLEKMLQAISEILLILDSNESDKTKLELKNRIVKIVKDLENMGIIISLDEAQDFGETGLASVDEEGNRILIKMKECLSTFSFLELWKHLSGEKLPKKRLGNHILFVKNTLLVLQAKSNQELASLSII